MKNIALSTIILGLGLTLLSGCGGSSDVEPNLTGGILKGPIDGAVIQVSNVSGTILSTTSSTQGKFSFTDIELPRDSSAIFIESQRGTYTDEATGSTVTVGANGLMTVFTAIDLENTINVNKAITLTAETTIVAKLAKALIASGTTASTAINQARQRVQLQLIDGTNPISGASGDSLLLTGDLTTPLPADQSEALARNRAISFSYEAQALNLNPDQVFELINARALDLVDGTLDGQEGVTPILITDKNGTSVALNSIDQKTNYSLARLRLVNNTAQRLRNGQLSADERTSFARLGFDVNQFDQFNTDNQAAIATTQTLLTANNLPAFQRLPVLIDEDGNAANNAATYTLTATPNVNVTINAPGTSWVTPMLRYNNNQLPPIIKATRGNAMTLNFINNLAVESTVHWHGFKIPGDQDGGPDFPVLGGSSKVYSFTMSQPAASLWFHPHPDMNTGDQVYKGLAGVFLLDDAISQNLVTNNQLPSGIYDIPMLVQDRRFSTITNGVRNLLYKDSPMDQMGMFGNDILVNGVILPKLAVETRQYRFRIYNTSNARSYDFALSDGSSFKVIGTDGGLLDQPVTVNHILLGAAERAEIIIDFGQHAIGDKIMLISKAFSTNAMGMMTGGTNGGRAGMGNAGGGANGGRAGMGNAGGNAGGMNTSRAINGARLDIMRFDITTQVTDPVTLYTSLPNTADINTQRLIASDATKTRNFVMTAVMGNANGGMNGIIFAINGKTFDLNRIDETITLSQGNTEIWSVQNNSMMEHPFHAHAIQWQILDRNGVASTGIDLGWKDTVLVQPGGVVRIIGRFDATINTGDYMYHCHILEHEDAGMMGFFRIQ